MQQSNYNHIIIFSRSRTQNREISATIDHLYQYLSKRVQKVDIDTQPTDESTQPRTNYHDYDLMIVVGGDGNLLNASLIAVEYQLPVVGINRGFLGFLTDVRPQDIEQDIEQILSGQYQAETRFLLEANIVSPDNQPLTKQLALNEVALLPSEQGAHMIEFTITLNDDLLCQQRADGVVVATPTGSTAYALSGGGPILHPSLNALVLVPMCPHTLSSRPIVIDANDKICIGLADTEQAIPKISCDGRKRLSLPSHHRLNIHKHPKPLLLLHPLHYNYYETLRTKLGWQTKHYLPC